MKSNYSRSHKQVSALTLVAMVATQLSSLGLAQLFALSSTFTAVETQTNIPTTQSVTTLTVDVAGLDTDTLTLDGCTISFTDFGPSDIDCTDGVGNWKSVLYGNQKECCSFSSTSKPFP